MSFALGYFSWPVKLAGLWHMNTEEQIQSFRQAYESLRAEIGKVIVGHDAIVEGTLIAIFGGGHVLLDSGNPRVYSSFSAKH